MAAAPSFGAATADNTPPKLPIGVLTAATITTSFIYFIFKAASYKK